MASFGSSDLTTGTEYGNLREERYPEVEGFDQFCSNLKIRIIALHEGDLKDAQRLYRGAVVMAYDRAKAKVLARKPPDCEEPTIRQNSLNSKLKLPYKNLARVPENLV